MDQFAIVELMGHRRFGARVSESEQFGQKFLRAEIVGAGPGEFVAEQLVHPQSIYAVTLCTEDRARAINTRWSLQSALPMLPDVAGDDDLDADDRDSDADILGG